MFCNVGLHRWVYLEELDLHKQSPLYIFQPFIPEIRICKYCNKSQMKYIDHCYGVHPPEYRIEWRDLK